MANKSLPISSTTTVLPLLEKFGRFRSLEVMMSNRMQDISTIQREFEQFLKLFNVNIRNTRVNFFHRHGLRDFLKQLENVNNSIVVSTFDPASSYDETIDEIYTNQCALSKRLSKEFNKTVLFWPCQGMRISHNLQPSFESISFAIKSISKKLNWSEICILVTDKNWGLPLAIAANIHIPFRLNIDIVPIDALATDDKTGRAIIVTSPLDHPSTLATIHKLHMLNNTKVLLIDTVATSFNTAHSFYRGLSDIPKTSRLTSNILVLTILSDRYRRFLQIAFKDRGIELVRNFRRVKRQPTREGNPSIRAHSISDNGNQNRVQNSSDEIHQKCPIFDYSTISKENASVWCGDIIETLNKGCQLHPRVVAEVESICNTTFYLTKRNNAINDNGISDSHIRSSRNSANGSEPDSKLTRLMENFYLFDFLLSSMQGVEEARAPNYDFVVVDFQRNFSYNNFTWRPFLILERNDIDLMSYTSHPILPGYNDWLLDGRVNLWKCEAVCWLVISICAICLICIIIGSVALGIGVRNYLLRKRLSKGPNKIVLSANDFVFPVDSRRVDEGIEAMLCCWLQQLQEFGGPEVDKPDLLKGSIGSLKNLGLAAVGKNNSGSGSLARHNNQFLDMRARYNGDLVQLKEVPMNGSLELKSKAMDLLVLAHGLRHENINPLIGWLSDTSRSALVFDYCSRGSLQDVLIMDEIKLDWSFRLSLLTDLVRGMRYLHSTPLRVHGALTSRNCVVDARWVLKVTDYGLPAFYEAQGLNRPHKCAKELLWTAPEILRNHKGHNRCGTQFADVYSFGIVMQEVVVRGEPYCMLSLTPEEIITKLKKPPPLIRPSVSKGAAPPEAINIMRQCWAETPDMRPDFNSIYERFKLLNHGRKVNFVDTMFQMLEKYSNNLEELIRERTEQLDIERKKTEQLLNRMLPSSVAEKLKMGLAVEPEEFSDVTIYFSDIVGFTTIAAHCSPVQVVDLLNDLYTIFDATINAYNVYKVETIGDAYMVVSGLPVRIPNHAEEIATMALDLLHQSGQFKVKHLPGVPIQLRIGLHTGPCCAGVVGLTMPRYCLFGDTVNTASRMESTGSPWRIHMSEVTRDQLETAGGYSIETRGPIEIKGKGMMNTYWLLGKKGFDKVLPTPPPIGLDETLIRNSIILKAGTNRIARNCTTTLSSSQSSSLAGDTVEVKVEITPPPNTETSSLLPNSYSLDSNNTTLSANIPSLGELTSKTPGPSPQQRKLSEFSQDGLLNPANFNRLNPTGGSSSRLYKKIEEMMDLSSPYNQYKCLSPSESNLTQFNDGKYLYALNKIDSKPGSSRLLRRQFSLDKDDLPPTSQNSLQPKGQTLDIPLIQENRSSPTNISKTQMPRLHKQTSTSIAQDLEKIEEIPLSPVSSQHHSSLDSSLNRSPPTPSSSGLPTKKNHQQQQEIQLNVEALMSR
ncbi:unnamed protein product [Hermetia illucens]|uniref:Guanylate cyclase n=1 Tax=Hermetia illucens TaxID=343691 RepID=A0A7R8V542_HERIL|nr:unnamed protein product [Hermetia illucens]